MAKANQKPTIIDARTAQKLIGIMGLALPVILVLGYAMTTAPDIIVLPTLSEYVYTQFEPLFTGILFAIGIMFFAYKGYAKNQGPIPISDNALANIAGTASIITAIAQTNTCVFDININMLIGRIHVVSAVTLLISMALFCLFYFTQTSSREITAQKRRKNSIYHFCGYVIVLGLLIGFVHMLTRGDECITSSLLLWLEWIMIWAFSIAWCVKGGMLFRE